MRMVVTLKTSNRQVKFMELTYNLYCKVESVYCLPTESRSVYMFIQ